MVERRGRARVGTRWLTLSGGSAELAGFYRSGRETCRRCRREMGLSARHYRWGAWRAAPIYGRCRRWPRGPVWVLSPAVGPAMPQGAGIDFCPNELLLPGEVCRWAACLSTRAPAVDHRCKWIEARDGRGLVSACTHPTRLAWCAAGRASACEYGGRSRQRWCVQRMLW